MHLKSGKVLLRKGGMVTSISTPLELSKSKEDFIKTNTIVECHIRLPFFVYLNPTLYFLPKTI